MTVRPHTLSDSFADELLRELADFPAARARVTAVLRKWGGERVYVPMGPLRRGESAADLARALVFSGIGRGAATAILAQRRGLSTRQARRLVAAAVAMRGQTVSASMGRMQP